MKQFNPANTRPATRLPQPAHCPSRVSPNRVQLDDLRRGQRESLAWLAQYNAAVAQAVPRRQLLEIFDATYECVMAHFCAVEDLLARTCWSCFKQQRARHCRFAEQLSAHRGRLAGGEYLDTLESTHVLDGLLIHFTREQPLFNRLDARLGREYAERGQIEMVA